MSDRRRNGLILMLVLGLMAASAAVLATKPTRLGLDLKGGVELTYQAKPTPQQPTVTQDAINRSLEVMRERVDSLGVSEPEIQRSGRDQITVGLPSVKNAERAVKIVGQTAQLYFYDWEANVIGPDGKPHPADLAVTGGAQAGQAASLSHYQAVLRGSKRPPQVSSNNTTQAQYYLVDPAARRVLRGPEESRGNLTAEHPAPPGSKVVVVPRGTVIVQEQKPDNAKAAPDRYFVLRDSPALSGKDLKDPKQEFNNGPGGNGDPIVTFKFTKKGQKAWQQVTRTLAQRGAEFNLPPKTPDLARQHFAAVLDGKLITVPFIDFQQNPDGIDGKQGADIEGGFTIQSAQDLAQLLKIGALPVRLDRISESQVSATLGKQALHQGLLAGVIGLALVALFLIAFYRVLGLIAVGALIVYALYFYALIKLIPITMTLPGIAGLILTIGVAADANIVIFERVKEEIRAGASIPRGIAAGYKKGLSAIIDANVVTIMTAFILFEVATAGVKGFAFTLGLGTIVSLFTAVLATQAILASLGRSRILGHTSALGAGKRRGKGWTFNFMGASKWFFSMSGIILLVGALAIGGKGLNFGIDFESGTRITTGLQKPANESQIRSLLSGPGLHAGDAKIQRIQEKDLGPNAFQISSKELQPAGVQRVRSALDAKYGVGQKFSATSIGPTFGQTVATSAIYAIIASLLVISAYIALRFEWKYAVPVLIALMHDILIVSGIYSLTGREVTTSTVAALLTILGYSLYDTIIVFDRIRENVPRMPRAAFSQIVNRSMSEVLTRSLATTGSTLIPILALLIFGGETLRDFAFALLVGVASGAYSSIFIASPVLTHWKEREAVYVRRRRRIERDSGGLVPAYAVATVGGVPTDAAPEPRRERRPRRLTAPETPEAVSREEFDGMVADLHAGDEAAAAPSSTADASVEEVEAARAGGRSSTTRPARSSTAKRADKPPKAKKPRNRRHGRPR